MVKPTNTINAYIKLDDVAAEALEASAMNYLKDSHWKKINEVEEWVFEKLEYKIKASLKIEKDVNKEMYQCWLVAEMQSEEDKLLLTLKWG